MAPLLRRPEVDPFASDYRRGLVLPFSPFVNWVPVATARGLIGVATALRVRSSTLRKCQP